VYTTANLACEALLHTLLVGGSGVLEAEGHGGVAEGSKRCDEGRFLLVLDGQFDLVIAGVCVKATKRLEPYDQIDGLVNSW
jgi:hypothetical protein